MSQNRKPGRPKTGNPMKRPRAVYLTDRQYEACIATAAPREFSKWAAEVLVAASAHGRGA